MNDLGRMSLKDMTEISAALRRLGAGAASMEDVATRVVRWLYDGIGNGTGERACALVRFYKTHRLGDLEPELRAYAVGALADVPERPDMKCLTLLATVGDEPAWNSRQASVGHRAIPLPSHQVVLQLPMIAQLVRQLGVEISDLVASEPGLLMDIEQKTFNVFHVPEARGSEFIPAQESFVVPHRIASVLGFGGMLPSGDLFAVIMFSRAAISHETADLFKPLALSAKLALLPFSDGPIFS